MPAMSPSAAPAPAAATAATTAPRPPGPESASTRNPPARKFVTLSFIIVSVPSSSACLPPACHPSHPCLRLTKTSGALIPRRRRPHARQRLESCSRPDHSSPWLSISPGASPRSATSSTTRIPTTPSPGTSPLHISLICITTTPSTLPTSALQRLLLTLPPPQLLPPPTLEAPSASNPNSSPRRLILQSSTVRPPVVRLCPVPRCLAPLSQDHRLAVRQSPVSLRP